MDLLKDWVQMPLLPPIYIVDRPGGKKIPGTLLYTPDSQLLPFCQPLSSFLKKNGAEEALKNLISFSDAGRAAQIPYIWDEFNKIFQRTGELLENSEFYYYYHYRAFREMIEDRIEYAELRCSFTAFGDLAQIPQSFKPWDMERQDADGSWHVNDIPFLDTIKNAADDALRDWNREHPQDIRKFKIGLIMSARRDLDILQMSEEQNQNQGDKLLLKMDMAILLMNTPEYRDMIVGFDLVSEEDRGRNTYCLYSRGVYEEAGQGYREPENVVDGHDWNERHPELQMLRIKLLDFYLHDGESTWAENDNILDACVISRHRIGHGFNMTKFPSLVERLAPKASGEQCEPREPFLEICPISNQMLRYFTDLRTHGAYELIKSGVQCVLGNDDPMIDGSTQYVMTVDNLIADFNKEYWEPFLQRAHDILKQSGLI